MKYKKELNMKFSIKENRLSVSTAASELMIVEQISTAYEDLMCSYMDLTDAERSMEAVCDIINNINTSIILLKDCGNTVIPGLNNDAGLESLMGISEKLITAGKAIEALEQQKKSTFEKFKEFVSKAFKFIADFFKKVMEFVRQISGVTKNKAIAIDNSKQNPDLSVSAFGLVHRESFDILTSITNGVNDQMEKIHKYAEVSGKIEGVDGSYNQKVIADLTEIFKKVSSNAMGIVTFDEENNKLKFAGLDAFYKVMDEKGFLGNKDSTLESLKYNNYVMKFLSRDYFSNLHKYDTLSQRWEVFLVKRSLSKAQDTESEEKIFEEQTSFNFSSHSTTIKMICSIFLVWEQLYAALARHYAKHIGVFYKAYKQE